MEKNFVATLYNFTSLLSINCNKKKFFEHFVECISMISEIQTKNRLLGSSKYCMSTRTKRISRMKSRVSLNLYTRFYRFSFILDVNKRRILNFKPDVENSLRIKWG